MKALALISGGLDSILAARLMREEGIEVISLSFKMPFLHNERKHADNPCPEIKEIDVSAQFLEMFKSPRYGYGAHMNPCIDCKVVMLAKAKELLERYNAKFVVTGEVLGQRPMSQHKQALAIIARRAGLEGLVLRPLSAKLLPVTIPEQEGWVNRERLLAFSGRSRTPQIELAKVFGIEGYLQPAGGCLLTDKQFSKRIKDLLEHNELNIENIESLKTGRHFRVSPNAKLIVGRDEMENKKLFSLARKGDYLFMPTAELSGPTSLGRGAFNEKLLRLSAAITCRYCDLGKARSADILYKRIADTDEGMLNGAPIEDSELVSLRI